MYPDRMATDKLRFRLALFERFDFYGIREGVTSLDVSIVWNNAVIGEGQSEKSRVQYGKAME